MISKAGRRLTAIPMFLILVAVAAGRAQQKYDLTVNCSQFEPHLGQKFVLRLVDRNLKLEVSRAIKEALLTPDFQFQLKQVLVAGRSYDLEAYADYNLNNVYDNPPYDHSWRLSIDRVSGPLTLSLVHNTQFVPLDFPPGDYVLKLSFAGMTPHLGERLSLRVKDDSTHFTAADTVITAVDSAAFELDLGRVLVSSRSYSVDFYADHNVNGRYDSPPVDHAWRLAVKGVAGDRNLNFKHNTNFTDVRFGENDYDLGLEFLGMEPHLGQRFALRVLDSLSLRVVADTLIRHLAGPDFRLRFERALAAGRSYWIDFYADLNGNGHYDPPPADHAWRLSLGGVISDSDLSFRYWTGFTDVQFPDSGAAGGLDCDFDGDGRSGLRDVLGLLLYGRSDPSDLNRLDWNMDGRWDAADAVEMARRIRDGECP